MQPNVLVVTVDSLRADHVGCVRSSPVRTPNIDEIGETGTVFTAAYAQGPFTTFSMPSLFSGRYPSALDYVEFSDDIVGVYPGEETTMGEAFSREGYDTAGFHSNPLLSELFGFDSGFDVFSADMPLSGFGVPDRLQLLTTKLRRLVRKHAYLPADSITDRAAGWLSRRDSEDPFFLWTHYMDVHGPYQRKSGFTYHQKYRAERLWQKANNSPGEISEAEHHELQGAYREEVSYTDGQIGRLLNEAMSDSDRHTIVVITADHGDGFGEHGYYGHPHEVDDILLGVPLVISDPTGTIEDSDNGRPVELVDVLPTLLHAVDGSVPKTVEGASLGIDRGPGVAISEGELKPDSRTAFVTKEWKYVDDRIEGVSQLIDRSSGERVSRDERPERYREFAEMAEAHYDRPAVADAGRTDQDIGDSDTRARLRELGYLE